MHDHTTTRPHEHTHRRRRKLAGKSSSSITSASYLPDPERPLSLHGNSAVDPVEICAGRAHKVTRLLLSLLLFRRIKIMEYLIFV